MLIVQTFNRRLPLTIVVDDMREAVSFTAFAESTLRQWTRLKELPEGVTGKGLWARRHGQWTRHRTERMKRLQLDSPRPV